MDFSGQINKLFKPAKRAHSPTAELSVRTGAGTATKDFQWLETSVPCQKACPAGTDIPAYLTAIAAGNPDEAYRINLRDNVFPAVLGRVCSRPCESACRHGYDSLGESVAICFSKRSASDFGTQEPMLLDPWFPSTGKKVAVIGSGVAGLAAARNLTLFGHRVTVYEKHAIPGGMLNQGIPEFRLPREIIDREIAQITGLGVEIVCGTAIGEDLPFFQLLESFDAVVMAAGTLKPNLLNLPGHELPGIRHGLDFLLEVNETGTAVLGERVIVIGGGFTAMDCARTANRLGAQTAEWDLKVLCRRSRDVMRVTPGELEELDAEGIPLECHATPLAYVEKNGKLAGMRFRHTGTHKTFNVPADTVLLATGQFPEDVEGLDPHGRLFTAGDYAHGASSLIEAIADGKATAEKADLFLMGEERLKKSVLIENAAAIGRTREMDEIQRQPMPMFPTAKRNLPSEVELGYDKTAAVEEAKRCYRCHYKFEIDQDKCIKCDWCLKAKPRPECILMLKEIRHDDDGRIVSWAETDSVREMNLIWINQDECIRCGACIKACPVDAITLQKVSLCIEPAINNTASHSEDNI
ncbi:FAD-dependent oxidoreductase [Pontiella sulfatireligans]|uniref:NADPH-Fe(3+) oxidoreductase subunit beta n=1 Tax=Pontiella sulfatireligans TaxID=2750658 RepID=A0A6C2UNL7_9BACT|nr:FAD-dependent oxidoreductase [Pontiella sulfatireligans]VGO21778.1 NADPH-Fe(3+) oxidoreductase subunit beta [Pontiella sulfatireligans]